MVHQQVIDFDAMRGKLKTLSDIETALGATEPLSEVKFKAGGSDVAPIVKVGEGWQKKPLTDPVPVTLALPGGETYWLTRQATMELASECRITRGYQTAVPANLLQENMTWWLKTGLGERELKLLVSGTHGDGDDQHPLAVAMCRRTISPFSNLKLLEVVVDGLRGKYGQDTEILADYKFTHNLEDTWLRLIVPGNQRVISGTPVLDDTWSTGIQFRNSMIGLKQTEIMGYHFRWWCTNGCTDVANSSGGFSRRGTTEEDVLEWAATAVDEVLGGLEDTLDQVQSLVTQPVADEAVTVLRDLFRTYGLPQRERRRVIEGMADSSDMSMYGLLAAVTQAANYDKVQPRAVAQLLDMGGHIAHAAQGRCGSCKRLLPEGYAVPGEHEHLDHAIATVNLT
jgi:hypothetical protein